MHLIDAFILPFAKKIPDGGLGRDHVRLIAAVRDDVVGPLLRTQMPSSEKLKMESRRRDSTISTAACFKTSVESVWARARLARSSRSGMGFMAMYIV